MGKKREKKQVKQVKLLPTGKKETANKELIDTEPLNLKNCQVDPTGDLTIRLADASDHESIIESSPDESENQVDEISEIREKTKLIKKNDNPEKNLMRNFISWVPNCRDRFMRLDQIRRLTKEDERRKKFQRFNERLTKTLNAKRKEKYTLQHFKSLLIYSKKPPNETYLSDFVKEIFIDFLELYPEIVEEKISSGKMKQETRDDNLGVIDKLSYQLQAVLRY